MAFVATSANNLMAQNVSVHAPINQLNDQVNTLQIMPQNIANIGSGQVIMLQPVTVMSQDSSGRLVRQTQYQIVKQNSLSTNNFTVQPQQMAFLSNVSLANTQVVAQPPASQVANNFVTINGSCLFQLNNSQLQAISSQRNSVMSANGATVPSVQTSDNSLKESQASQKQQSSSNQHQQEVPTEEVITLDSPVFKCEECDQQFERWGRYQRHLKTHEEESLFRCEKCPMTFTVQYNLTLHMAVHKTESLECPECHKKFSRLASLKSHILLHVKEEIFPCPVCLEEFANQTQLDRHQRKKHKVANLQNASNASKNESSTSAATGVQSTSSEDVKKEVESLTSNTLNTPNTLIAAGNVLAVLTTNVLQNPSTTHRSLICGQCKMAFDKVAALKEHLKMHRLKQFQNHRKYKRLIDRSRFAHQCNYCSKSFQKPSQLTRHLRIHTGERPYKCDSCDKAFNQRGALIIHLSRHTGNRPFKCPDCPSSFSQRGNLRAHVQRVHPTLKEGSSFKCFHCSCIFKKLSSLNAHLTRFHGDPKFHPDVTMNLIDPQTGFLKSVLDSNDVSLDGEVGGRGDDVEVGGGDKRCREKLDRSSSGQERLSDISLSLSAYSNLNRSNLTDNENADRIINDSNNMEGNNNSNNNNDTNANDRFSSSNGGVIGMGLVPDSKGELMTMIMQDAATGAVAKHFIRKVNGVRWHQCNYCSKEFKKPSDLIRHVRVHTRERPYSCPQCYRSFSVKSTLTSHIRTHSGVREFKCHVCSKWFSSSSSLHTHSRLHTGVRPFKCRKCDRSFRTSGHRASHERSYHSHDPFQLRRGANSHPRDDSSPDDEHKVGGGASKCKLSPMLDVVLQEPITITEQGPVQVDSSRYASSETVGSSNRPYVCLECLHSFKKSSHLKQHIRSHTGEKPYTCKICHKGYVSGGVLKAHMKTHQGSKDHKCPYCHHAFTTVGSMRRHMTTHSDKRDFICPYCQKAFKTRVNCKKHIKTHRTEVAQQTIAFNQPHQQQQLQGLDDNNMTNDDAELAGISDLTDGEGEMGQISLIEVSSDFVQTLQQVVNAGQNGNDLILQHIPDMQDGETHQLLHHQIVNNNDSKTINHHHQQQQQQQQQLQHSSSADILNLNLNTLLAENTDGQGQHRYVTLQPIQHQQHLLQHKVGSDYSLVQSPYPILLQEGKELLVSIPGDGNQAWTTMMLSQDGEEQAGDVREDATERVVGEVAYQCPLCEELCPDVDGLRQHIVSSHGVISDNNQHFVTQLQQQQLQQQQQQQQQPEEEVFPCEICSVVFHSSRSLRQHMTVHSGAAAAAPAAGVAAASTVPAPQMPQYFCDVCLLTFRNASRKVRHMQTYHQEKDSTGSSGGQSGKNGTGSLESPSHDDDDDEDYFDEEDEDQLGDSMSEEDKRSVSLSKHILLEVKKEGKRIFQNQNSRTRNANSSKHLGRNQRANGRRSRGVGGGGHGESLNQCYTCNKTFKKPSDLVRHVRIHTGEKPYACDQCNRRFTVKSTLDNHLNTHNPGEKKFHCHMCNSPFSTKGSLKVHMRLHTGSRPFKCLYCDQRFRTSGHRKSHMSHHLQLMVAPPNKTSSAAVSVAAEAIGTASASVYSSLPATVQTRQHQKKTSASKKAASGTDCTKAAVATSDEQVASEEQSEVFDLAAATTGSDNSLYDGTNVSPQAPLNLDFNISITNAMGHSEVLDGEAAMQLLQLFGFDPSAVLRKREDGETEQQQLPNKQQTLQSQFILQQQPQQQTITLQEQPGFSKNFLVSSDSDFAAATSTSEGKSVSRAGGSAPGVSKTRVKDSVVASLKKKALLSKNNQKLQKGRQDNKFSKSILKAKYEALKGKDNQSNENTTGEPDQAKESSLGDQQQQQQSGQQYSLHTLDDIFRNHQHNQQQQLHKNNDGSGDNVFGSEEAVAPAEGILGSGVDPSFFDQGYLILQPDLSMSETFMSSSENFLSTGGVGSYSDGMGTSTSSNLLQSVEALFSSDQKNLFQTVNKPSGTTSGTVGLFQQVIGFSLPTAVSLLPSASSATSSSPGQPQAKVPSRRCPDCGKAFYKPCQLIRHRRIHTGEKPFECSDCGKQFNQKNALKIHSFNHKGVKPHPCSICGQEFSQKGNLKAHVRRIHKNIKPDQANAT